MMLITVSDDADGNNDYNNDDDDEMHSLWGSYINLNTHTYTHPPHTHF